MTSRRTSKRRPPPPPPLHDPWWEDPTPDQTPPEDQDPPHRLGFRRKETPRTQKVTLSNSILDNVIPVVYGSKRVVGYVGFWNYVTTAGARYLDLGIIFSHGEQDSVASVKVCDETTITGITISTPHTGDGSSALSSYLTGATGWTAADTTQWKSYAHVAMRIDCKTCQLPGAIVVSAKLGGRKVAPIGGGTKVASSNPARVAYDILTDSIWLGHAAAKVDATSFGVVEDWCDEVMGDSKTRYSFTAALYEQDPQRALERALKPCIGQVFAGPAGKIHAWSEWLPPLMTGTWTSTVDSGWSMDLSEDSTAGAATTEATVGSIILYDNDVGIITAIADDDNITATFLTDPGSGTSSKPLRVGTSVRIDKGDWVEPPVAFEDSITKIPDIFKVYFEDDENRGTHHVTATYGSDTDKVSQETIDCTEAAHVVRYAKTRLQVARLETFSWAGRLTPDQAGSLLPGDLLLMSTDLVTDQPCMVQQPITMEPSGLYRVKLREFDPSAFHEGTQVTDTLPSTGTPWDSDQAQVTNLIQYERSGTVYDLIGSTGGVGRVDVGNSSKDCDLTSATVRLPNNIPIYALKTGGTEVAALKMDTSNRLVLGDGAESIYINTSGEVIFPEDGYFKHDYTSKVAWFNWSKTNTEYVFGNNSYEMQVWGDPVKLIGGTYHASSWPSSGFETYEWRIWKNGTASAVRLYFYDGSSFWYVGLAQV